MLQQAAQAFLNGEDDLVLPWDIAEALEASGQVECSLSNYKRKNQDNWRVRLTGSGRGRLLGNVLRSSDDECCGDCNGEGQHLRYSFDWRECETCNGTGECPSIYGDRSKQHASVDQVVAIFEGVLQ